jgi:chromosome segregation protein
MTLKGFKSFAESTTLDFERGVTVVVGPNGSGKSNVVDAIAWVLGAQAPGSVRSQKMEDVIFAGTAKRPALGRAEVSLTIDNTSKVIPLDFNEITISRTLFRDGDSEYAMNNVPCRLLDIQEMLSDSGVGRHQHVIVSQGQIDAVLNARPEDRRSIIEEAAGVLKYRKRREKSERRLKSTEENLTRLQDLLREVKRQLKPLERQADAARRHGSLFNELMTLKKYLAGKELTVLREGLNAIQLTKTELTANDRKLKAELEKFDNEIEHAEKTLADKGFDEGADQLADLERTRERAKGLKALITERIASLNQLIDSQVDQGVVETLEAEAARLKAQLLETNSSKLALEPETMQLSNEEKTFEQQRFEFQGQLAAEVESTGNAAAESRGQLAIINASLRDLQDKIISVEKLILELKEKEKKSEEITKDLANQINGIESSLQVLGKDKDLLDQRVEGLRSEYVKAQEKHSEALLESKAWIARADALSLALEESREQSGIESVSDINGVLGAFLDLVDIDSGWEAAFHAAVGNVANSVVVRDTEVAKESLQKMRSEGKTGGVIISQINHAASVTTKSPLRDHVRSSHREIDALLNNVLSGIHVAEDWEAAISKVDENPDIELVTLEGDYFNGTNWRLAAALTGATGSALDEAVKNSEKMLQEVKRRSEDVDNCRKKLKSDEVNQVIAQEKKQNISRHLQEMKEAHSRAVSDNRAVRVELGSLEKQEIVMQEEINQQIYLQRNLADQLPELEDHEAQLIERTQAIENRRQELESIAAKLGAKRTDIDVRLASIRERETYLNDRLIEIENRLLGYTSERDDAELRRVTLEKRLRLASFLRRIVSEKEITLESDLHELRELRREQSQIAQETIAQLDELRSQRSQREKSLAELREENHRAELKQSEYTMKLESITDSIRRELDCEPGVAVATKMPPLENITPKARLRELERELKIMGPINPLALEEYEELNARNEFLQEQLEDVRNSRKELNKVIKSVDQEIVAVFSGAFADISINFTNLFATLFPGGEGSLKLTEPDNLLETGIEIEAKPSGKNIKKLSLLSGGERSLTSLAFLFSIFRSRPSPFYVMDEVEAALDDVNLQRFLQLVNEFRDEAQLIIVSHQKRTMETADCLYGVTMKPGGSSKVVSERPTGQSEPTALFEMTDAQTVNTH